MLVNGGELLLLIGSDGSICMGRVIHYGDHGIVLAELVVAQGEELVRPVKDVGAPVHTTMSYVGLVAWHRPPVNWTFKYVQARKALYIDDAEFCDWEKHWKALYGEDA